MSRSFLRHAPVVLLAILLFLSACSQPALSTPLPATETPHPTASQTVVPLPAAHTESNTAILSIEEDGYAHLFAYDPASGALTRLTNGDWDDITPAISPDKTKLAFASNRLGHWDLFLLDLASGELTQLTDTPEYDAAPSWSPDGFFLAYETYHNDNLEIVIGPATDPANGAIFLTQSVAADHSPAWAPGGRQIAFISDGEVLLADLDRPGDDRFQNLSHTPFASESHPVWSPDGTRLAWAAQSQNIGRSGIYLWETGRQLPARWIGDGNRPAWNAAGDRILTTVPAPNSNFILSYTLNGLLLQPLTPFPYQVNSLIWTDVSLPAPLPETFAQAARFTPAPLWAAFGNPLGEGTTGRWSLVELSDVQAPYPQLHDLVDEAFNALRQRLQWEAGWDVLASLENAFVPLTSNLDPGLAEDWLYTGRAFAINSLMTNAGWMVAVREDFGAQTYWRLYIRAQAQDGTLGMPLHDLPWDLHARYNLDPQAYEQGGAYAKVPPGYWVDVTSLAAQYGWERLPALPNWRTYYRGARFTEFVLTGGLDWHSAMLQLYPVEVLVTPTRLLPPTLTPTRTPTNTPTPTNTRTPRPTRTPTPTRTPSPTSTPSPTFSPTSTPVTVVP